MVVRIHNFKFEHDDLDAINVLLAKNPILVPEPNSVEYFKRHHHVKMRNMVPIDVNKWAFEFDGDHWTLKYDIVVAKFTYHGSIREIAEKMLWVADAYPQAQLRREVPCGYTVPDSYIIPRWALDRQHNQTIEEIIRLKDYREAVDATLKHQQEIAKLELRLAQLKRPC